jgi:membrane-associated protein
VNLLLSTVSNSDMDILTRTILPYILLYKYWALFFFTFLSSLAVPVPAGTLLIASAGFASQGYFNLTVLWLVAASANVLGDNIGYWIARIYGEKFFDRFSWTRRILNSQDSKVVLGKLKEHPGAIVFVSRFEVMATLSVNAVSGLSRVPYRKYLFYEVTGSMVSTAFYGTVGFLFGDSWQVVNSLIGNFSIIVFLVLIGLVLLFWKKMIKKWRREELKE